MKKLIDTGLFGQGLTTIDSPILVDRYNKCLDDIGLPTTQLKKFSIDGIGWSPEIAQEQDNEFYLSHGGPANPYIIILTPAQENKPIYFPYHSFDRYMMHVVFSSCKNQITDITTQTGLWVNVDQEISAYQAPQDLLMIDSVMLKFRSVGRLMLAARHQRKLVRRFYEEENAWGDPMLHQDLMESCKQHGDLRFRSLDIPDLPFNHVRSFYSKAFDGIFVFRDLPCGKPVLIMQNGKSAASGETEHGHIEYNINDKNLFPRLFEEELITMDFDYYRVNPFHLKRLHEFLFVDAYAKENPESDVSLLNEAKITGIALSLSKSGLLSDIYFELERLQKMIHADAEVDEDSISGELKPYLARPNSDLPEMTKRAAWQLLTRLSSADVLWLYTYDKEEFFKLYLTWPKAKQLWAINLLKQDCIPAYA